MNDNEFYALMWKIIAFVVVALMATVGGCTAYESSVVRDMVANGAEPMAARCSISPGNTATICAIQVSKVQK